MHNEQNSVWDEIRSDYMKAKYALYSPEKYSRGWWRDDKNGKYYMWKAYHTLGLLLA